MAKKQTLLEQMENNPRGDWTMQDIEKLAKQEGMELRKPARGSHHALCSPHLRDILTIPHNRPIKVIYIKHAVSYARAHRESAENRQE